MSGPAQCAACARELDPALMTSGPGVTYVCFVCDPSGELECGYMTTQTYYAKATVPVIILQDPTKKIASGNPVVPDPLVQHLEDLVENPGLAHHYDTGKPRLELLDPYAMRQVGLVLAFGAKKYPSAKNWMKGLQYTRLLGSTLRHVFAFIGGEDLDPESGLPHPAHAMCCLMFLLGMTQIHPELDDRETV